jgi:putative PIN family toxin of toxin-antitoxin system
MERAVVDTNVFVSAIMSPEAAPRQVLRHCLTGKLRPLMGNALFNEYEELLSRSDIFRDSALGSLERGQLLDAFMSVCQWVSVYYLWRPNLADEADNHLVELAVAGQARWLITGNKRHVASGELLFPDLRVATPREYLDEVERTWAR